MVIYKKLTAKEKKAARKWFEDIKTLIKLFPENYDQANFCGAECCLAGWGDILLRGFEAHNATDNPDDFLPVVLQMVGVDYSKYNQIPWIFDAYTTWPSALFDKFMYARRRGDHEAQVKIACTAINRFMKERGI